MPIRKSVFYAPDDNNDKEEPVSEKIAKSMAIQIEKDLGKDARREFHDIKIGEARTMSELRQDATDIYHSYGKEPCGSYNAYLKILTQIYD